MCLHNFGKVDTTFMQGEDAVDVKLERGDVVLVFPTADAAQGYAEDPTKVAPWALSDLPSPQVFFVGGYANASLAYAARSASGYQPGDENRYVIARHNGAMKLPAVTRVDVHTESGTVTFATPAV